ncbi:uncharacterized protein PHALS_11653 [Plasmopara halstedii]|uniref:Uncharacterized protein n=1 Tax=Plasmopara halstedii TaxID=4781 RepID=A0A0P1AKX1_PLAHL|nr:uncharacterized protein PHALS_11653 [Plasmopara halstedii]CEG41297.1 hypothetical protein PHALS_11653 [Plasmopara halstedii]|eukprot:XP_024577666.1 hypothetical protein PHALS_11653 [Plasmopara halstedii]
MNGVLTTNWSLTADTWRFKYCSDGHVLPIYSDLKSGLQHKVWDLDASGSCLHGCTSVEYAQHFFGLAVLHYTNETLFNELMLYLLTETMIVFSCSIRLENSTSQQY